MNKKSLEEMHTVTLVKMDIHLCCWHGKTNSNASSQIQNLIAQQDV